MLRAMRAASSMGYPYTPQLMAGKAIVRAWASALATRMQFR